MADVWGAAITNGQRGSIRIVHEIFDEHVFDGGARPAAEGEGVVHSHCETAFNVEMFAVPGKIECVVVILLFAVYDFEVCGGERIGVGDGDRPVCGAEQKETVERN